MQKLEHKVFSVFFFHQTDIFWKFISGLSPHRSLRVLFLLREGHYPHNENTLREISYFLIFNSSLYFKKPYTSHLLCPQLPSGSRNPTSFLSSLLPQFSFSVSHPPPQKKLSHYVDSRPLHNSATRSNNSVSGGIGLDLNSSVILWLGMTTLPLSVSLAGVNSGATGEVMV